MTKDEPVTNPSTEVPIKEALVKRKSENFNDNKDRTLFCINIDQRCTEEILYELFLQAGPIENVIRKEDRNGNLICLIIYKHIKSCDYAIKILNGITLFNMSLKVQLSQAPGTRPTPAPNNYANNSNKDKRRMSLDQNSYASSPNSAMLPPQQQQFSQFMSQQLMNPYSDQINRSVSGSNLNFDEQQNQRHHSRRSGNYNQNRDNRGYSNDNRRNYSNNNDYNHNRNGSNQRKNSRENHDRYQDQSQSPQRKRNRF